MEPFDFYDYIDDFPEQLPCKIDFINNSDDDENDDKIFNDFPQYTSPPNYEIETNDNNYQPDESPPNIPHYTCHSAFLERIKNELGITKEEYEAFMRVLKDKLKDKKPTYERIVTTHHESGTIKRSTTCCRRFISLSDDARIFQIAFFHFTYGNKFQKKFVKILHNHICGTLHIKPINRDQFRSIRQYFSMFLHSSFEIIFQGRKYCMEHPEFIEQIAKSKRET